MDPFSGDNKSRLLGLKPGDTAQVDLPNDKENGVSKYELSVVNVEEQVLPELNEEFIKAVEPNATDESSFREIIKNKVDDSYARRTNESFERQLADNMIDFVSPEFAPAMVDSYLEHIIEEAKAQEQEKDLDEDKIRESYRPVAERNMKWYLVRRAIINSHDTIVVSRNDVEKEIEKLIERSPDHAKEIKKYYKKPSNRQRVEDDLLEKKVLDYLTEFAKIKDVKVHTKVLREEAAKEGE